MDFWLTIAGAAITGILSAAGAFMAVRIELAVMKNRLENVERELQTLRNWVHSIRGML